MGIRDGIEDEAGPRSVHATEQHVAIKRGPIAGLFNHAKIERIDPKRTCGREKRFRKGERNRPEIQRCQPGERHDSNG